MSNKTIRIESLSFQGSGVGKINGKICFVPFSAPGDLLQVEISRDKGSYQEAELKTIIEPSACRTEPQCSLFGVCGGCSWQHLSYETQIKEKQQILKETLKRISKIETEVPEVIPSPKIYSYRNSVRIRWNSTGEFGFYKFHTHDLVPVSFCPILEPQLNEALKETARNLREGAIPMETSIQLDEDGFIHRFDRFTERDRKPGFLQANHPVNQILKEIVVDMLKEISPLTVLDLYCGNGNLSLPLAHTAERIEGWDSSEPSIQEAIGKAKKAGYNHIRYRRASIKKIASDLKNRAKDYTCLILDPPRQGLKGGSEFLAELKIPWVLYISCNPPVLARDIKLFYQKGYRTLF